jgi:ribosomal protein S27AE
VSAEPAAVGGNNNDAEERRLWQPAGPPRICPRCGAEMSNQFVSTGEHDDTRRWVCPRCGNQDMRSRLEETIGLGEEVSVHKTTVTPSPTDNSSGGPKKD